MLVEEIVGGISVGIMWYNAGRLRDGPLEKGNGKWDFGDGSRRHMLRIH